MGIFDIFKKKQEQSNPPANMTREEAISRAAQQFRMVNVDSSGNRSCPYCGKKITGKIKLPTDGSIAMYACSCNKMCILR